MSQETQQRDMFTTIVVCAVTAGMCCCFAAIVFMCSRLKRKGLEARLSMTTHRRFVYQTLGSESKKTMGKAIATDAAEQAIKQLKGIWTGVFLQACGEPLEMRAHLEFKLEKQRNTLPDDDTIIPEKQCSISGRAYLVPPDELNPAWSESHRMPSETRYQVHGCYSVNTHRIALCLVIDSRKRAKAPQRMRAPIHVMGTLIKERHYAPTCEAERRNSCPQCVVEILNTPRKSKSEHADANERSASCDGGHAETHTKGCVRGIWYAQVAAGQAQGDVEVWAPRVNDQVSMEQL